MVGVTGLAVVEGLTVVETGSTVFETVGIRVIGNISLLSVSESRAFEIDCMTSLVSRKVLGREEGRGSREG